MNRRGKAVEFMRRVLSSFRSNRMPLALAAFAALGLVWLAAPARAAVSCSYDAASQTVSVSLSEDQDSTSIVRSGDVIAVNGAACGAATITNTTLVRVTGGPGFQTFRVSVAGGQFTPVDINIDLGEGDDWIIIDSEPGVVSNEEYHVGADGINLSGDNDIDVTISDPSYHLDTFGEEGDDFESAAGGFGTGAPYPRHINMTGGPGNDTLTGGDGSDTINGGNLGDDELHGGGGDDFLEGNTGNDVAYGDAGGDTFFEEDAVNGSDSFIGGPGDDAVSYAGRKSGVSVSFDGVANDGAAGEHDNAGSDVEDIYGSARNDRLTASAADNVIYGMAGDDVIRALAGNDRLVGGPGDDTLEGGAGKDSMNGLAGKDRLAGGAGNDKLVGGGGIDALLGGSGRDNFFARDLKPDVINGGTGRDRLMTRDRRLDSIRGIP